MSDCLFCKMVAGEIQPDVVFEDDDVLAFRDVNPQAPTHVLVIPKQHIATTNDLDISTAALLGKMFLALLCIARKRHTQMLHRRLEIHESDHRGIEVGLRFRRGVGSEKDDHKGHNHRRYQCLEHLDSVRGYTNSRLWVLGHYFELKSSRLYRRIRENPNRCVLRDR